MNALTTQQSRPLSVFHDMESFENAQRMAKALIHSDLVPAAYRGEDKMGNALIAMDMANRVGVSAMVVMQNMHIIEGRPSWSSSFIIAALNSCGLFSPLRFKVEKLGEREVSFDTWTGPKGNREKVTKKVKIKDMTCVATAVEKETGELLEGPEVSIAMAVAEGWYTKAGSKWVTMADLMIRYRAAAFFGRLYAPHIMNGMHTDDEVYDTAEMRDVTPKAEPAAAAAAVAEETRPAGRARGVHAAMAAGSGTAGGGEKPADAAKKNSKKKEPPVIEAEATEIHGGDDDESQTLDTDDGEGGNGDVFGDPDEDDGYNPA